MLKIVSLISLSLILSGCHTAHPHKEIKHHNSEVKLPIQPESLLDLSSERVSFALNNETAIDDLTDWVNNDHPTRAELSCTHMDGHCRKAMQVLTSFSIPHKFIANGNGHKDVTLIYERVTARDCVDLATEVKATSGYVYGCANAANMLHMISDHQQFIKPNFVGAHDASRAIQQYNNIYGPNSEYLE